VGYVGKVEKWDMQGSLRGVGVSRECCIWGAGLGNDSIETSREVGRLNLR
jgi:hypothetical protein